MKALGKLKLIAKRKCIGECTTEEPCEGKPHAGFCEGFHNNKTFMKGVRVMNSTRQRILKDMLIYILFFSILIVAEPLGSLAHGEVTPPNQPSSGPGGEDYPHAKVTKNLYKPERLKPGRNYWLYEPADPAPDSAPVVVFLHGWSGISPKHYGAWIEHLVRRGNIVIYPRYQATILTPPDMFTINAIFAVDDALQELESGGHVMPKLGLDEDMNFAVVGHSAGGNITANMAALADNNGLPQPKAVMCVQPGDSDGGPLGNGSIDLVDLSTIPAETLLLTVLGDMDDIVTDLDAKRIFNETTQISWLDKNYIIMHSDDYGDLDLVADHFAPCAPDSTYSFLGIDLDVYKSQEKDALDYYGFWKLFDGLCDAAFYDDKNRDFALGDTHNQRFMGYWSDDTPVIELEVSTTNITVTSPEAGEGITIGSTYAIEWSSLGIQGNVKIELCRPSACVCDFDNGEVLTDGDVNVGSFEWAVTGSAKNNCQIRITSIDNPDIYGESGLFNIVNPQ